MNFNLAPLLSALPEGRVFALDKQVFLTAAIQLLNAGILTAILGFLLYKPVREYMHKRSAKISEKLSDAQNKTAEAEALKAEYEKKIAEIELERIKILEAARLAAEEKTKEVLAEARAEAETIKKRAEESILQEQQRLRKETRLYIIELSSLIAAKYVEKTLTPEDHARLFDEAVAQLEEAPWQE